MSALINKCSVTVTLTVTVTMTVNRAMFKFSFVAYYHAAKSARIAT